MIRTESIGVGEAVNAYRNLNLRAKGIVGWSVQAKREGRLKVVQHAKCVLLTGVSFKHATPEQARRVQEGCREVCAWVKGAYRWSLPGNGGQELSADPEDYLAFPIQVQCDPKYSDGMFRDKGDMQMTLERVEALLLGPDGKAWRGQLKQD